MSTSLVVPEPEAGTGGRARSSGLLEYEDFPADYINVGVPVPGQLDDKQYSFRSRYSRSDSDSSAIVKERRRRTRKKFRELPKFKSLEKGRFVGRIALLETLRWLLVAQRNNSEDHRNNSERYMNLVSFNNKVNSNNSVLLANPMSIAVVRGRHGIGKTSLSYVYARAFENQYDRIFWLNAKCIAWDARDILANHLADLPEGSEAEARAFKEETNIDVIRIRFIHFLIALQGSWLLILDGADNPGLGVRDWLPNSYTANETSAFMTDLETQSLYSGPTSSSAGGYASTSGSVASTVPSTASFNNNNSNNSNGNFHITRNQRSRTDGRVHGDGHVIMTTTATKSMIENGFATFSVVPKLLDLPPLASAESAELLRQRVPHLPLGTKMPPGLTKEQQKEWEQEEKAINVLIDTEHLAGEPLQLKLLGNLVGKYKLSFKSVLSKFNLEKKNYHVEKYRKAKMQTERKQKLETQSNNKKKIRKQHISIQMTSKVYDVDYGLRRFGLGNYLTRVLELGIITMEDMSRGNWWGDLGDFDKSQDIEKFEELSLWVRTRISLISLQIVWILWKKLLVSFSPVSLSVLQKSAYLCEDRIPLEFLPALMDKKKSDIGNRQSKQNDEEEKNRPSMLTELCNVCLLRSEKLGSVSMNPLLQNAIRKTDAGEQFAYEAAVATLQTVYRFCHKRWAEASSGRHVSWADQQAMLMVLPQVIKVRQRCVNELSRNKEHQRLKILDYMERKSEKESGYDPFGIKRKTNMLFTRLQSRKNFNRIRGESEASEESEFSSNSNESGSTVTSTSPIVPDFKGRDLALIEADLAQVQGILILQMPFKNSRRHQDAENCFRAAHSRYRDYPKDLEHPKSIWLIGTCLFRRNLFKPALTVFEQALHQYHEVHGQYTNHLDVARCLGSIACTYHQMEAYPEAMKYHELSLEMIYDVCGRESKGSHVARALFNMGKTFAKSRQFTQAIRQFDQVFEIYKSLAEKKRGYDRQVGSVLIETAKVNILLGTESSQADALDCFNCAMRVYQRVIRRERAEMITHKMKRRESESDAETDVVQIDSLSVENLKTLPRHELIADAMSELGETLVEVGKSKEGRMLFEESLSQLEYIFADFAHPKYIARIKTYQNMLSNLGDENGVRFMNEKLQRFGVH